MEMRNSFNVPELHVAQQRRRDKLRFQHVQELQENSNFHHHSNTTNNNDVGDNNTSVHVASPMMLLSPEMFNYAVATATPPPSLSSNNLHNIHPTGFVVPSSSDSCDLQQQHHHNHNHNHNHNHDHQQQPPLQSCCQNWMPSFVHNQVDNHDDHDQAPEIEYQNSVQSWGACGNNTDTNYNELPLLPANFSGHQQPLSDAITPCSSRHGRGLSLSLSSNQICGEYHPPRQLGDQRDLKPLESGTSSSVIKLDCGSSSCHLQDNIPGSSVQYVHRNVGPLGPFTGYAAILKSSKFLNPAQHLLDELFGAAAGAWRLDEDSDNDLTSRGHDAGGCSTAMASKFRGSSNDLIGRTSSCESYMPDCHERKAKLLHMQDEVCKCQKQYHQQMQMVLSAFESVPGLNNATPYISRSLKTISRHFRCLKNAIADQLKHIKRALGEDLSSPTSFLKGDGGTSLRYDQNIAKIKSDAVGRTGHMAHQTHVWRPQRGLPERAVTVLRAWLFDHFLHPYPTDSDKQMLATQTGLTRNQVSNWFINARVRLWKPMVEEIHTLETKESSRSEPNSSNSAMSAVIAKNRQLAACNKFSGCKPPLSPACDSKLLERSGPSNSQERSRSREASTEQLFQKCSRIENHHQAPDSMDSPFISFLPYQRRGLDLGDIGVVSLTLGLRHGSDTTQQQLQHQFVPQGIPFGGHVIHDFSG